MNINFSLRGKIPVLLLRQRCMMARKLTAAQKHKMFKYLVDRDGYLCFYCKKKFKSVRDPIYEHLNNDETDDREDNLVLAHQSCNILKSTQKDKKYLSMAEYKLIENEKHVGDLYVRESFLKKNSKDEASTEITISKKCFDITEKYVTDNVLANGWVVYKETMHSIVYLCKKKIGYGSEQQIRSHILTLTSPVAPFEIIKDPKTKKKIIKKRFAETASSIA
uniref:HNH nuclease domain-containing protein n=1 Tax=uncultured marine thaumarchaeote KM3_98_C03 TaxID=1456352 RepID=A0A075I042_9ARCH|nr:hypothetical protein [uncultured marine thaumarchaeote KM3_98_C03]